LSKNRDRGRAGIYGQDLGSGIEGRLVIAMNKMHAITVVVALGLGAAVAAFALLAGNPGDGVSALSARRPIWTEVPSILSAVRFRLSVLAGQSQLPG
jgi:hypothetical protein